jgi:hypothetical protein
MPEHRVVKIMIHGTDNVFMLIELIASTIDPRSPLPHLFSFKFLLQLRAAGFHGRRPASLPFTTPNFPPLGDSLTLLLLLYLAVIDLHLLITRGSAREDGRGS